MNIKRGLIVAICVIFVLAVLLGLNSLVTGPDWTTISQETAIIAGFIVLLAFVIGGMSD